MAALLALLSAVGWGSSDYAAGVASRRATALSVVVLTHLTSVVVLVLCGIDLAGPTVTGVTVTDVARLSLSWTTPGLRGAPGLVDLGWGAAAGIAGGIGALLLYRGLARGAMAVVAPITAATAAAVPAVWGLAAGEPLTPVGAAGLALGLTAIALVSAGAGGDDDGDAARPQRPWARPGVADALGSGLGFGAFYVLLDRTTSAAGVWSLVAARGASVALFAVAALVTGGAAAVLPGPGARRPVLVAGGLDAVAAVAYLAATHGGYLSVVAVLSSLYPGMTVLLARTLARERLVRRQLAGLGCAGVAVALFALA